MSAPPARILVVDDEPASMNALCDTLGEQGYATAGCAGPEAALSALRESRFDLILTDLMMPGMSGVELLAAAQKIDPHLVGIIMTGQGTIETAVEAMKAGAFDYVLKPFKLSFIVPVLSRALAMRRLRFDKAALEASLRRRSAELEAANRELETFSYSVSHDLRAPLRAVDGYARILEEDHAERLGDDARRTIGKVRAAAAHMATLIDNLLEFSRSGRKALEVERADMTALAAEAAAPLRGEHPAARVQLASLPSALGDPLLLRQVWANLIGNAFKYSAKVESPLVEIGGSDTGAELEYWVRDNGAGFDMRYAGKLFGVFQRLHRAEEFSGTGVGLSIVQRIVTRHGGRIWAQGEVGKGACFHFALPHEGPSRD